VVRRLKDNGNCHTRSTANQENQAEASIAVAIPRPVLTSGSALVATYPNVVVRALCCGLASSATPDWTPRRTRAGMKGPIRGESSVELKLASSDHRGSDFLVAR
jgi:hypothetical protein